MINLPVTGYSFSIPCQVLHVVYHENSVHTVNVVIVQNLWTITVIILILKCYQSLDYEVPENQLYIDEYKARTPRVRLKGAKFLSF